MTFIVQPPSYVWKECQSSFIGTTFQYFLLSAFPNLTFRTDLFLLNQRHQCRKQLETSKYANTILKQAFQIWAIFYGSSGVLSLNQADKSLFVMFQISNCKLTSIFKQYNLKYHFSTTHAEDLLDMREGKVFQSVTVNISLQLSSSV